MTACARFCVVCESPLTLVGDLYEDGYEKCPNGHYRHQHSHGSHYESFDLDGSGHVSFYSAWHYTENSVEESARLKAREAFIEYLNVLLQSKKAGGEG